MSRKHTALLALLCALSLLTTGCTATPPVSEASPELTLPPAAQRYVAPIGDAALSYTADATLYLPRHSGSRLTAVVSPVTFSASRPQAESLVRALLNHSGTDSAAALGGKVKLSLYGANPVEVSLNVATVNLAASALQISRGDLYMAFQAITNTLTELTEIDYVNFLVVDRAIGLDVANTLPMGAFSRSLSEDVGAVYEQRLTRRVAINENASAKSLSGNVTLYFPLANTPGVLSEARACTFQNQLLPDMVTTLLREMGKGPQQQAIGSPALPLLSDLLAAPPTVEYSDELGGDVVYLHFAYNLDEMLTASHISRANGLAAIVYTLTGFFPGLAGVSVIIGEQPVETLMLTDSFTSSVMFTDYVLKRSDFAPLLYDLCTLYFADVGGQKLTATRRPLPYFQKQNPRNLLQELSKGPMVYDLTQGLQAVMPADSIGDADVLGLALSGQTILVNLAPSFLAVGKGMTEQQERLLAYAMVNTLCEHNSIYSASFFVSGAPVESFSGKLYWAGHFYPLY